MAGSRYIVWFAVSAVVTLAIFYVMQALISRPDYDINSLEIGKVIDFVRLRQESALELRKRRLPEKEKPEEAPPPPPMDLSQALKPDSDSFDIGGPTVDINVSLGDGPNLGSFEGNSEAVPLVRVQAIYPERAASRGIEGWVTIEFTITPTGGVSDERVIAAHPSSIFNRAALKAVRKFKYKPKLVDGKGVAQPNQKLTMSFDLEDN